MSLFHTVAAVVVCFIAQSCHSSSKAGSDHQDLINKYWKLTELMGKPVMPPAENRTEPHMILHAHDLKVTGSGGCNNFTSSYELKSGSRIHFQPLAATRMACGNGMQTENMMFQALQTADSYIVRDDTLQLLKARMAPLARFTAVYLQ